MRQLWERRTEAWCPWVYVAASDLRSIVNRRKIVYIDIDKVEAKFDVLWIL